MKGAMLFVEYNNRVVVKKDVLNWAKANNIVFLLWSNIPDENSTLTDDFVVLYKGKNQGLAVAYNEAIFYCRSVGIKHLQFFDDDSAITVGFLSKIWDSILSDIFIHVPNHMDMDNRSNRLASTGFQNSFINSGSIWNLDFMTFGIPEELFVDYIDHYVSAEASLLGLKIMGYYDIILEHKVGDTFDIRICGKRISIMNHSFERKYIYFRSRAIYHRRLFRKDYRLIIRDMVAMLKDFVLIILFENNGILKVYNGVRGYVEGMFSVPS